MEGKHLRGRHLLFSLSQGEVTGINLPPTWNKSWVFVFIRLAFQSMKKLLHKSDFQICSLKISTLS